MWINNRYFRIINYFLLINYLLILYNKYIIYLAFTGKIKNKKSLPSHGVITQG